jgi:uroporphyrinogen III methyltransferase/synthase
VAELPAHDGGVLSSPNGVRAFFDALDDVGLDVRALAGKHVAVVGESTAAACRRRGILADLVPGQARAEGLIERIAAEGLLGARWLHVRADEGRELLGPAIERAGGHYTLAIGYRTIRPAVSPHVLASLRAPADGGEGFDAVAFASGKTAQCFLQTMGEGLGDAETRRLVAAAKVVCLGPVTAAAVEALGLRVDAIASAPTDQATVEALHHVLPAGSHCATTR